ncbi:MAG: FdhF/YdeP family oxidoreductase [Candidatus Hydrogenedentes bacterium]|nr:FdhF/YdeP family oxidoreductase [Candidatus Hydrogenedentota bacterium]
MALQKKRWTPNNWASLVPFGIGEQRPNNYMEVLRALAENSDELGYAWRILSRGVCDGCALGTTGLRDWTLDGVHLCNIRLRLLRLNTMPALDIGKLEKVDALREMSSAALRELGRIPYPMIRERGDEGFRRITWDAALTLIADRIAASSPERFGCYLTSRGMPNEAYYVAQKAVRAIGTNNIDNAARVCHSPSTVALKATIGAGATTCSYSDWLEADLIVFIGSNIANNQPVATKYLHYAKKNGAQIVMINPYREPGMERYWIPSIVESALFGTKLCDRFFSINTGSDVAFLNGVAKQLIRNDWVDRDFIQDHTIEFDALCSELDAQSWEELEHISGSSREEMFALAEMIAGADKAVFVWSMGITHHECGVENVRAIINLALTKGFVGRTGCGLMPIRGHSGVQGGAEMGAYATAFPGGLPVNEANAASLTREWGFDVPVAPGMTAPEMIDAASDDALDVLLSVGGNFLEVLPDPGYVADAMQKIPCRVFMDIVVSSQMLLDPAEVVLLLPAATRYETPGGITQTSTERRVMFSPEIPGRRIGEARPEWEVFAELGRRICPRHADQFAFPDTQSVREEIARLVPFYEGIQRLKKAGDQFQYGGAHLCADWTFATADGKAHFSPIPLTSTELGENEFRVATRRGKQFNSMVHEKNDATTGATRRSVFINRDDAARLNLRNGDPVILDNANGTYEGCAYIAPIQPGNLQVHWPEGNVLIGRTRRDPQVGVPDYNAIVTLKKRYR